MKINSFIQRAENATVVRVIRDGLMSMIPILIIGAFSLILKTFPVSQYQNFVTNFANGFILTVLDLVYAATFGVLSVYMTVSISRAYMNIKADPDSVPFGAIFASMLSFFIVSGAYLPDFGTESMGPKSMFLAILTGLGASSLYLRLHKFLRGRRHALFSAGANRDFNRMLSTMIPVAITAIVFALADAVVIRVFGVDSIRMLLIKTFDRLFALGSVSFLKGFFFVLLSSLLWFFGIHGSDTLEGVMQTYFTPGLAVNQAAVAAGAEPQVILTKEFFDCFVLMGGCGSAICLLIALLLFSRNRARRSLSVAAAFPMVFNINELMVFGLPIIFNPVMLIPFLLTPLVCFSTAYLAIYTGLVPVITNEVAWTTPIILGGYIATGSAAGSLLQVFNVMLGVLIYTPFIRLLDKRTADESRRVFTSFMDYFRENEASFSSVKLTDMGNVHGEFAKGLSAELQHGIDKNSVVLAYQPQYDYNGACIGAEALLRWKHPVHGNLYPPLVVKLAEDGGFLPTLEEMVVERVIADRDAVLAKFGDGVKISFNVTGTTVVMPRFLQFLRQVNAKTPFAGKNMCLEITEQATLAFNEQTIKVFNEIREMGLLLAIDDFSMGQTSLNYLKDSMFDIIKLDGSLVKGLTTHQNCREIISSIVQLSSALNLTVIAEFVETDSDRETLHEIGCDCYQGYLYSPPVFLE